MAQAGNGSGRWSAALSMGAILAAMACSASRDDSAGNETSGEQWQALELASEVPLRPAGEVTLGLAAGCADGTVEQSFAGGIVGCAGTVTFPNRDSLCAPGYHPINAQTWRTSRGPTVPTHHYWTDDVLNYMGLGSGSCSAEYSRGTPCPVDQPMRVCAMGTLDPEGNRCNWTNCALDTSGAATTPNDFMGGCSGNATAGTLCVPDSGCVDGTVEQTFTRGMVGCAGRVTFANAAQLCTAGYALAYDSDWLRYRAGAAPTHNYWTATPPTHYSGTASACVATTVPTDPSCPADTPMRVCTPAGVDPEGNFCNWFNCDHSSGYSTSTNEYFGGCMGNTTAGALCVPQKGCADGTIDQQWDRFYIGCAGSVSWTNRESLCGPRQFVAFASNWVSFRRNKAPTHNYWTSQQLLFSGFGSGSCAVSSSSGASCGPGDAMHVCTGSGNDPEGNTCVWTHCGLDSTSPDQFLGGCGPTAGVLCVTGP